MNKLTIFFIGATVMVIGVVGTLLGYKYFSRHTVDLEVTYENEMSEEIPLENNEVVSQHPDTSSDIPEETGIVDKPVVVETDFQSLIAGIKPETVTKAGFKEADLEISQFRGFIFDSIDISEYQDDEHIEYEIKEQSEHAGFITELIFPTEEISTEVYNQLKSKIEQQPKFLINETNQYKDASFFANNEEEKNSVFLVVKLGERLYTLHYPAKNHNKMKNIISLL